MEGARRWIKGLACRFVAWLFGDDEEDDPCSLTLRDGTHWHPEHVRGMALVCRGENGHRRLVRRSECCNVETFDEYGKRWGMLRGVCWEDGTKASDDPPAI